jgi:hypothetical protein
LNVLEVAHRGLHATVTKNDGHPEQYVWIDVREEGKRFFLCVLEPEWRAVT